MDVNTKNFRIFVDLMKTLSFSKTAKNLGIAQPTASQQIAKLESDLGRVLFERHGHRITPTDLARKLYLYAEGMLEQMDAFYDEVQAQNHQPSGLVRYAMPESCQWTPHFRKIMREMKTYPDIQFEIDIRPTAEVAEGILSGHYDFGFITGEKLTPELRFDKFSDEHYSFVATERSLFEPLRSGDYSSLRLISFPGWELFFTSWTNAHGLKTKLTSKLPRPTVHIGTLAGAIHACLEGTGVAVLPTHCIFDPIDRAELKVYEVKQIEPPSCPIYLCRKTGGKLSKRAELTLELLKQAKLELK